MILTLLSIGRVHIENRKKTVGNYEVTLLFDSLIITFKFLLAYSPLYANLGEIIGCYL